MVSAPQQCALESLTSECCHCSADSKPALHLLSCHPLSTCPDMQSRDPCAGPEEKANEYREPSEGQPGEHVPAVPEAHPAADQPHCPAARAGEGCECLSLSSLECSLFSSPGHTPLQRLWPLPSNHSGSVGFGPNDPPSGVLSHSPLCPPLPGGPSVVLQPSPEGQTIKQ